MLVQSVSSERGNVAYLKKHNFCAGADCYAQFRHAFSLASKVEASVHYVSGS